jgi:heme oxygenase (mycobilin-producing)
MITGQQKGGLEMAVKIIIKRKVRKGKEGQLLPLLLELRSRAITQPGYISGETLRNVNDPEDHVVISTWQSAEHWKAWEADQGRAEIQSKIDSLLGEKTTYAVYYHG